MCAYTPLLLCCHGGRRGLSNSTLPPDLSPKHLVVCMPFMCVCISVYMDVWMYVCLCVCICAYASEWRRAWHDEVRCNDVAWCNQCSHAFPECHVFTLTYWFLAEVNLTYTQTPLESQSKKRRRENLVESLIQLIPCSNFQQQTGEKLRMQLVFFINMTDSAQ